MAYQNIKVPRFYINAVELMGILNDIQFPKVYYTLPVNVANPATSQEISFPDGLLGENCFMAILGHTIPDSNTGRYRLRSATSTTDLAWVELSPLVNAGLSGTLPSPQYDGFSISTFDGTGAIMLQPKDMGSEYMGSLILGTYYDMPNAPNLSLTMSREYGSTKEFTTYNGSSMSNTMWNKPPQWGSLGAWELDDGTSTTQALSRSGRKIWDMKFSFMSDSDLWGPNQMLGKYRIDTTDGTDGGDVDDDEFNYNILTDDNFFSQVWHKTLGGTLPFIFQPDGGTNGNNNPDQFAICRFVDNSLKATQSAFNVYDISLSIEEGW